MTPRAQEDDRGARRRAEDDPGFISALAWLWSRRRVVVAITVASALAALAISFLQPTLYQAEATLLPQEDAVDIGLLGQVASFSGINLGSEVSFEQLYGKIILSERLLASAAGRTWTYRDRPDGATLYEIFNVDGADAAGGPAPEAVDDLRGILRDDVVSFFRDERTGYMILRIRVPEDPRLAADLANHLIDELDAFNRTFQSRQAGEQRGFIEGRLTEVETDLREAEAAVTEFATTNHSYRTSPALTQRYNELQREVEAQTSVWIELRRQLELAKIDQNKNLVSVNVLDRATPPVKAAAPRRSVYGLVGLLVGLLASLTFLLGTELVLSVREHLELQGRSAT